MGSYKVLIKPSAVAELERLPKRDRRRVAKRIQALAVDPRPHGAEKLSGLELHRVRQGDYRVVYTIHDADSCVVVVRIAHRRQAYR